MTFILLAAAVLLGLAAVFLLGPLLASTAGLLLTLVPLLFTAAGLYSCVLSAKPTNIKLLWIIIIVLAPLLGPLLWFFWGKHNT